MKRKNFALSLTRGAMTGALYVALTYLSAAFGLSSGVIQFRLSEALCILPLFFPEAIWGLFVGCLISNILTGALVWDVIFGSVATLIGAVGAYLLRKTPFRLRWCATLPTVFSNAFIIPLVLIYAYGAPEAYPIIALTVGIGEAVCAGALGSSAYYLIKRMNIKL